MICCNHNLFFSDGANGANAAQDPWTGAPGTQGPIQSGSYPSGHSPYGTSHLSQPSYPPPPMHGVHDMVSFLFSKKNFVVFWFQDNKN